MGKSSGKTSPGCAKIGGTRRIKQSSPEKAEFFFKFT
jgi:hypothetical protein